MSNKKFFFTAVVGNPPYQLNIAGRSEQPPIYHLFYNLAFNLAPKATLITPARFLFNAGKTPKEWNEKMLRDEHLSVALYSSDTKNLFPNVDIKGGVAICYRDNEKKLGPIGTFSKSNEIKSIMDKVLPVEHSIGEIVYSNTSYKYSPTFFKENPSFKTRVSGGSKRYMSSSCFDKFPEVLFEEKPKDGKDYALIIGRKDNERTYLYFKESYLTPPNNYKKYKVMLASTNGNGAIGEKLTGPFIGEPGIGATETFITIGNFESKGEAENLLKYIKSKFARIMLATKKVTQGNKTAEVWTNIPLQDFTVQSDIDWNKSISEIDQQLYKKYGLSPEEIAYIEEKVQPMQ